MDKFVFGITGPTGAGKSTVSEIFRSLGVYVADADIASRAVTKKGSKCLDELVSVFGSGILDADGELNRKILANIVFSDKLKLQLLNDITHKYIKEHLETEINRSDALIAAIDGAVIIGSPVRDICKCLVVVTAESDTRIKRIVKRDNISFVSAAMRVKSQMTDEQYQKHADFIIKNNDSDVGLEECVEYIYNKIKDISKAAGKACVSQKEA